MNSERNFSLIRMIIPIEESSLYKKAAEDTKNAYSVLAQPGEMYDTQAKAIFDASLTNKRNEQKLPPDKIAIQIMGNDANPELFWNRVVYLSQKAAKENKTPHATTAHP